MHYVRGLYVDARGMTGSTLGRVVKHEDGQVQVQLYKLCPNTKSMIFEGDIHTYEESQIIGAVTDLKDWVAVCMREWEGMRDARRIQDLEDLGFSPGFAASCVLCNTPPFERVMAMRAQGTTVAAISKIFEDCLG
jgi:hypothetical protein